MQITVPANIGANPITIILGGLAYKLGAGETIDVPSEIAEEFARMVGAKINPAPAVPPPFEDAAVNAELGAINDRIDGLLVLPDYPTTDGTYSLQLVMDSGTATLTWESAT